jgi:hypothetical protein
MKGSQMFAQIKNAVKSVVRKAIGFVEHNSRKVAVAAVVGLCALGSAMADSTAPDATSIATNASTAFGIVAPITISIVGFYVILKIAKRVVS